jgi:flagella basal body P-ring formation protein FlgA
MLRLGLVALIATFGSLHSAQAAALSQDAVREAIAQTAKRNLPDTLLEIEVRSLKVYGDLDVPAGVPELRVLGRGDWLGRVRLEIEVSVDGAPVGTVSASVELVGYVEIPVLRRSAGKGVRLGRTHFTSLTRPLDFVPAGALQTVDELVGRTLRRDLRLGAVVREADLEVKVDARRGRPVTIVLRSGALTIKADGVIREDGRIGSWVDVATKGGTKLRGLLVSPDVVELGSGAAIRGTP